MHLVFYENIFEKAMFLVIFIRGLWNCWRKALRKFEESGIFFGTTQQSVYIEDK